MQWYHDLGNDRWICEITGGKRGGFFVEAGALDGIGASASYALEQSFEWTGICVEPNSVFFPRLVANRKCICDMRCLADAAGTFDFIEMHGGSVGHSGIREHLSESKREFWSMGVLTQRPAISLSQLLKEHHAPRVVDYLALDTEGSEKSILGAFDFDEYQINAISIEGDACTEILTAAGYTEVRNPFSPVEYEHYYIRQ